MSKIQSAALRRTGLLADRASVAAAVTFAALLGVFLVWGVGFAGSSVIHNAAHDTRHAASFPCH
ncbi:MAG: CbtB domain-containing protein [Pseudomonadota bacterium]